MTALLKVLALLNGLEGNVPDHIQGQLDKLVEQYGHGVVEKIRYIAPGLGRSSAGTHFLTLASARGAEVTLEIQLRSKAAGWILDAALDRL